MGIRITKENFIKLATERYKGKFDYSKIIYVDGFKTKVEIICPIHGSFWQTPTGHLRTRSIYGCYKCRKLEGRKPNVIENNEKLCTKCGEILPIACFGKDSKVKSGLNSWCRKCAKIHNKEYKEANKYIIKVRVSEIGKKKRALLRELNKDKPKPPRKKPHRTPKPRTQESFINEKIGRRERSYIRASLKGEYHSEHSKELLGCSFGFMRQYIESLFQEGMTWDNWMYYGWHIDHIKPIVSFNLSDIEQKKACFHYTNQRPLWRKDNQHKSSTYNGIHYRKKTIK